MGGTEEKNYEDGEQCENLEKVNGRKVTAVVIGQEVELPKSRSKDFQIGKAKVKLDAKITNVKQKHGITWSSAFIDFSFKVDFNCNVSVDFLEAAGIAPNYELFYVELIPCVYVKGSVDLSFYGKANLRLVEKVDIGFHYEDFMPRLVRQFKKDSFTITAEATMRAGVILEAGFHVIGLKGKIYSEIGSNITAKSTAYTDGKSPAACHSISAYMYASVGYNVTLDIVIYKGTLASGNKSIYTQYNSPIRMAYHYEDGKLVSKCTRGTPGMGYGGWGYFSPMNSQYYYAGNASGAYGDGEAYTVFTYSLNEDNQATVTGYQGNAVNVFVPETLDGYPVVGIGNNAFKGNTRIRSVSMPDCIEEIGYSAFQDCTGLERIGFPENEKFVELSAWAFHGCKRLESIKIPDSVTKIGSGVFWDCGELSEVILPKMLEEIGDSAFYNCDKISEIEIPKSLKRCDGMNGAFRDCDGLKKVKFEKGTTEIAEWLFEGCIGLEKIEIPDTVTVIETGAFQNCENLQQVDFSENLTKIDTWAFDGCKKLESIKIPDSVTEIGGMTFGNCEGLKEVTLPKMLEEIGGSTFFNCDKISEIEIPKSLKRCDGTNGAFENCDGLKKVIFEKGTTEIAESLFEGCTGLEMIEIPDTVTIIEQSAFRNCVNLQQVGFNRNLTKIEVWAFDGCKKLESIKIPDSVTEIGGIAFGNCEGLMEVTLPKMLEEIGGSAFYNCDKLSEIEIPKSLKRCDGTNGAFENCDGLKKVIFEKGTTEIAESLFEGCTGLEMIEIPDTVTIIEQAAFRYCVNLRQVEFSKDLTKIEAWAFWGCKKLEDVKIPEGVTEIGIFAFRDCISLKEATIADTVTSIGGNLFSGCTSLMKVHIPNIQKRIPSNMFYGCTNLSEINLPETLTEIESNAFYDCDALTEASLPSQLKWIESNAFYDCDALTKVSIPNTVTDMEHHAFYHCDSLAELSLGTGLTSLPDYAFAQCPELKHVVLPYRMAEIGDYAFNACTGLTEITIPRSTKNIGSQAFSYPGKMTIFGISGTYAETYAKDNRIKFVNQEVKAESASLSHTAMDILKWEEGQLFLTVTPANFTDQVSWKSSNADVAEVTEDGIVRAVSCGTATIKVTVGNVSASCMITVNQPVTSIRLSEYSMDMQAGETRILTAFVYPEDATDASYEWSSSNPAVASVDSQGEVTALAKGEAEITAKALDGSGITASCKVQVTTQLFTVIEIKGLQSPHPYENNCSDSWKYTLQGAPKINVTFSEETEMEDGFDSIHLYDKNGSLIGTYTDRELAGKTITVEGDTIQIKLETDDGGTAYGFKVEKVEKSSGGEKPDPEKPDPEKPTPEKPTPAKPIPKKGAILKSGKERYKVTKVKSTVALLSTTSKSSTLTIPATVKVNGISYKVTALAAKAFQNNRKLTKVKLGNNILSVGDYAFKGCTKLKSITIGAKTTSIGKGAFWDCTSLPKAALPNKVTTIGDSAFCGCKKLKSITFGTSLKKVGKEAFLKCSSLSAITVKSSKVTFVGKNALKAIKPNAKIKVPPKKYKAYQKLFKGKGQGKKVKIIH